MADRSVAIRLATAGKATVVRDITDIGDAQEAQAQRWQKAYEKAGDDVTVSLRRQAQAAAKIAAIMPQTNVQFAAQTAAGTNYQGASARDSAAAFRELLAAEDALDAKSRALLAILEPVRVAQERYNAEVADAAKLHDANRISLDQFIAAEARAAAALERTTGASRTSGQAETAATKYSISPDTAIVGKSAAESASALSELLTLQEQQEARATSLRAKLDPLYVAQQKYDAEIKSAGELLAAGAISQDLHSTAVASSEKALAAAKREVEGHSSALNLNRTQMIIGQSAVMRFTDSLIAGQSPIRAFALEAHKLGEVISFDDGGVAGGMAKLTALLNPLTIGLGAIAVAAIAAAVAGEEYAAAEAKLSAISEGTGRLLGQSGEQLEASAEAAARAGNITISAARDIETGYLKVAKAGDVLIGLTAITKDFAAATGTDMKAAQAALGAAFADPIKGAQDLTEQYGVLTQAQIEHISKLVEEGNAAGAQRALVADLKDAFDGASEHATGLALAWERITHGTQDAWNWLGKYSDLLVTTALKDNFLTSWLVTPNAVQKRSTGPSAADLAAQQRASSVADDYTGANQLEAYRKNAGALRQGLNTPGLSADQRSSMTTALDAYSHALDTFIPKQDKANQLAALDAKIAATKVPAAKAALAAQREQVASAGEVVTSADVLARAHSKADAAAARATHTNGAHAASLARQAESMEAAAKSSLDLADAYLKGDSAAIEAEARRKAVTDATRKGIDVEAQVRRQLNLNVAEAVATGAKSVAQLRDETSARTDANAKVDAGKLKTADLARALSDEAALRPLLRLQTVAQGSALTALTKVIDAYREALDKAHTAESDTAANASVAASQRRIDDTKAAIADLSKSPRDQAIAAAYRAGNNEADDGHYSGAKRQEVVDIKTEEAYADFAKTRAKYVVDQIQSQQDSLALSQRDLELQGANEDNRTVELDQLKASLAIKRLFPEMTDAERAAILKGIAAQDALNAKLKVTAAALDEVRQFGGQFVDDVLNPDTWSSWGNAGKTIINDLKSEFIKLALINPLKNLINGNSALPTLSSAISNIGKLFGGGSAAVPHNASGTESFSGGATWVNENGPEIADLPNGTRIYPAAETRRMLAGNDNTGGGGHTIIINADRSVLSDEVRGWVSEGIAIASTHGAAGGAALGQAENAAASARTLGRRW
ncbi:phage tail length tape measure family protein [Sphingomonas sp. PAMC 26605]|uniref:phage tail length tape measure family protein n=1 Tax=Sphingomonas sp. PAMC 26605 TaxID=1112214 RepID=UPI00026CDCC0|nr:phage tail length tape measure family protein [Sphingomonas sp. PAMC 26605]